MDEQMIFDENGKYNIEPKPPIKGFPELNWTASHFCTLLDHETD